MLSAGGYLTSLHNYEKMFFRDRAPYLKAEPVFFKQQVQ